MEPMWDLCHPQTEEEMIECATLGKSLSRLSQPTILMLLAANDRFQFICIQFAHVGYLLVSFLF